MNQKLKTHCRRGHKYTKATVRLDRRGGYTIRECKLCQSFLFRHRYKFDEEFRCASLARSKRYYKRRQQSIATGDACVT